MYTGDDWLKQLALGAASGVAGTLAVQAFLTASQRWLPSTVPPLRQDPAEARRRTFSAAVRVSRRCALLGLWSTGRRRGRAHAKGG